MRLAVLLSACALLLSLLAACGGGSAVSSSPAASPAEATVARAPAPVAELPDIPAAAGPLDLRLTYPRLGAVQPDADSTFLFGTTGTGNARLTINGTRIPLAANGAFVAYLPTAPQYVLAASTERTTVRDTFRYGQQVAPDRAVLLPEPRRATVISGRDTLAAGSEILAGRPVPGGDRRWFFPIGTRLTVDATLPGLARVRLAPDTHAWVTAAALRMHDTPPVPSSPVETPRFVSAPAFVDVRIPADFAPFDLTPESEAVGLTLYGRDASDAPPIDAGGDGWLRAATWSRTAPDASRLLLLLNRPLWGVKAFYESDGTLVLRLRRPPARGDDLQGLRIVVDAGHPPGGAIGPTGLREADANLAIARRVAERLQSRGARVLMTRTSEAPLENAAWTPDELWARVDYAVRANAHLLVSIHNNAFPDGVNPFDNVGTEMYYFHPFAKPLATHLSEAIAPVTGLPNKGARRRSLALVRPTWMPAVLTESLYLMMPQHEAALRDPAFLDRLADAHVRGIVAFVTAHTR